MAVSGTIPSTREVPRYPLERVARWLRRGTLVLAIVVFAWFLLVFGTRWVPRDMHTLTTVPAGAWCIVDRWALGLRVGSDVFVDTPAGPVLSRVVALDAETVSVRHTRGASGWPDSDQFGVLPRRNVQCTVLVVFPQDHVDARGR